MSQIAKLAAGCLGVALMISGCSSPQQASKANFAKVIERGMERDPITWLDEYRLVQLPCFMKLGREFPQVVEQVGDADSNFADRIGLAEPSVKRFDALIAQGILTGETVSDSNQGIFIGRVLKRRYDLTEKGRSQVVKAPSGNWYLPYCKIQFKAVESYSEPAQSNGMTVSRVNYTYRMTAPADWARDQSVQTACPEVKALLAKLDQPIPATTTLTLMNEGWSENPSGGK